MIKSLTINISAPFCNCHAFNHFVWGIDLDDDEFYVKCDNCKARTTLPFSTIKGHINFDKDYPVMGEQKDNILYLIEEE